MDKNHLGIDIGIDEWGPTSVARIAKMRQKLSPADAGHSKILAALNNLEKTYLARGYQQKLRALVARDEIVFSHNDVQENNILTSLEDNSKIFLIDYEYGMWNPKY